MKKLLILLLMLSLFAGCEKGKETGEIRCKGLVTGLQTDNVELVKQMITDLASGMKPRVTDTDRDGHYQNYIELIRILNDCGLKAVGICYGCIDTLPAMSEIRISITTDSGEVIRIIDLAPDASNRFVCKNMHR